MKTKIYNNLILFLLFACSFLVILGGAIVFAQSDGTAPASGQQDGDSGTASPADQQSGTTPAQDDACEATVGLPAIIEFLNNDVGLYFSEHDATRLKYNLPILTDTVKNDIEKITITVDGNEWEFDATLNRIDCDSKDDIFELLAPVEKGDIVFDLLPPGSYTHLSISARTPPTSLSREREVPPKEQRVLHLYSTIFNADKTIAIDGTSKEAVTGRIQGIFGRLFSVIFTISGILMVLMLAIHGTQMIYAEFNGDISLLSNAKGRVKNAAIGTAILMLSWVFLNFIDPNLLRPKLFGTITGLNEVGRDAGLFSNDIAIPNDGVRFDEEDKILQISKCPQITNKGFQKQVSDIQRSLGGEVEYFYTVYYSKYGDKTVYGYAEDDEGNAIAVTSEYGSPKKIICNGAAPKRRDSQIAITSTTDKIVVFPNVSIIKPEDADKKIGKEYLKSWLGSPEKYTIDSGDILAEIVEQKKKQISEIERQTVGGADANFIQGNSPVDTLNIRAGKNVGDCPLNKTPDSGIRISFKDITTPSASLVVIDEKQYRTELLLGNVPQNSDDHRWRDVYVPGQEMVFCINRNSTGFKITPQFSVENDSTFKNGVSICYQFSNKQQQGKSNTFRTLSSLQKIATCPAN